MRARGKGNMKLEINTLGKFNMYGDYVIDEGDYLFTLQNIINKKFLVEKGGVISWSGNPSDAMLEIKAVYKTRTALYNLLLLPGDEYKKRMPIECQLYLTGRLLSPTIKYDIVLPNAAEETRNKVREAINNDEELSKQFLSLLVMNSFYTDPARAAGEGSSGALMTRDIGRTTSLELLSNQLSNWMSQLSKDFDIGVNYRAGDQLVTRQEVEVALSTQLLNDRVSINGNFDVGTGNTTTATNTTTTATVPKNNSTNLTGDFNLEVKLVESGKLRFKVFSRLNDQTYYQQAPYTQGIGLFYRDEFSSVGQLSRRYQDKVKKIFVKKEKKQ
jgi:hypothetical protein